jgi:hypothetical protein
MAEVIDYQTLYHGQDKLKRLGGKTLQNFLRNYALFSCKIQHSYKNEKGDIHRIYIKLVRNIHK